MTKIKKSGNSTSQDEITRSLVSNLIAKCNLPLHIVENEHFRVFLMDREPSYQPISYKMVVITLDDLAGKSTNDQLVQIRTDVGYSIALDSWSGRDKKEYIGCMVTYMADWKLNSFVLSFAPVVGRATSQNIFMYLRTELDRMNVSTKPFTICTDNCATMKKAFRNFDYGQESDECLSNSDDEECFCEDKSVEIENRYNLVPWHGRAAHLFKLVVNSGLTEGLTYTRFSKLIAKCKKVAGLDKWSNQFSQHLSKRILQTTEVRWNSFYSMITRSRASSIKLKI